MPEYQFAEKDGSIVTVEYDKATYFSPEQVLSSLKAAFSLFPSATEIAQVEGYDDVFHVTYPEGNADFSDIYVCAKGTTPGGRNNLKDEQRIQPKAKFLNYVNKKGEEGKKAVFLGVYCREEQTIFCTWKVSASAAGSEETPISKQIKIHSIAKAIKEGFVQQDKGKGEFACAFKPEFLYFYLKNSYWLHTGPVSDLSEHTEPESDDDSVEQKNETISELVFETGLISTFKRNRILFGAPGTGKSFTLNDEKDELLGVGNDVDFERVTFHPDYSYANFVGTYKPTMVKSTSMMDEESKKIVAILQDKSKTAQEKYDLLYDKFKDEGLTRLPVLLGIYTDENFETRKLDGTLASGNNSVERNHGRAIRQYVNLGVSDKKEIAYEYVPGPFMRVLVKALKSAMSGNPKPYLLVVEEINRANVAAVFGDVFQLLDRDKNNISEYAISTSNDMRQYLADELSVELSAVESIKIPDNMFIWATMNSADQGVFPMDTAFKRRWDFKYLGIDDAVDTYSEKIIQKKYVLGKGSYARIVGWNDLREAINDCLSSETFNINEDKLLGPYFISKSILESDDNTDFCDVFKNKVLMYLFDDAVKQKKKTFFEECKDEAKGVRYSDICKLFDAKGVFIFPEEVSKRFTEKPEEEKVGADE